ncbi:antitoxin Xre/MbcA/ParS toxin-binding domain-containing protein [Gordonia liuliyuniae]|uniref:DUF2384 domain-containing protein n=1 Tax=Gordonia liuliyuniae TaxID=2911517 RepID=A0ABS9IWM2_9ACTN|nr:antitoxin Xre/MbcA/ParS toxin-binding domain-containing protein [Gordonia liuliyuniae]MCF8589916.1 DUF2384 domain-containing protein [Gordonia liuliyuniae]
MDRKAEIVKALRKRLDEKFAAAATGADAEIFTDIDAIADAMIAALPTGDVYDQAGGPFYDTAGVVSILGISKQAVAKRVAAGTIIGCQLTEARRTWVYPVWQFTDDSQLIDHLDEVWTVLRGSTDAWTAALWLRTRNQALGGATAVDYLRDGRDPGVVLAEARADAARWAG